jgi:hypothetical protein
MKTDPTKNKHGGNAQSNAAFALVADTLTDRQNTVLERVSASRGGITSKELANALETPLHAISGRITELKAQGRIREHGRRDGCAVLVATDCELPQGDILEQLRIAWQAGDREERHAIKVTVEAYKRDLPSERETVMRRIVAHLKNIRK